MGWKKIRDHYRIKHIVHVRDGAVCVGSVYVPDILVISADGTIENRFSPSYPDLARCESEMRADVETLRLRSRAGRASRTTAI